MSVINDHDAPSLSVPMDSVCVALGCSHFVTSYRFSHLFVDTPTGRSPRLAVSRYYWDLTPPVAVDFVRDLRFGEAELVTKKEYFTECNIRYILVKDAWDGEGAEKALTRYLPDAEQAKALKDAAKPLTGPRRRRSQSS